MVSEDEGRDLVRVEAGGDILRHPRELRRGADPILRSYRSYKTSSGTYESPGKVPI